MKQTNWMQRVNGELSLNQITIPGTHDSGTQHVTFSRIARCQNTSVATQLQNGFRFLDIRLALKKEKLYLVHAQANCKQKDGKTNLPFDNIIDVCMRFLKENPSETILMSIKKDRGFHKDKFAEILLKNYYSRNPDKWYLKNETPKLDDARGKIVLLRRYKIRNKTMFRDENSGLNFSVWPDQKSKRSCESITFDMQTADRKPTGRLLEIQDRYSQPTSMKWKHCVLPMLKKECEADKWYLNFLSTMNGGCPEISAAEMNRMLKAHTLPKGCHGVIICDYGSAELAKKIYETNF